MIREIFLQNYVKSLLEGDHVGAYMFDLAIVALCIIGITAMVGVLTNSIGIFLFGGKKKSEFVDQSQSIQVGWNSVGGKR